MMSLRSLLGFSFKSNQYGLTVDTVTAFELAKPNGQVVTVTQTSDPELFFGLKVRLVLTLVRFRGVQ